MNEIV